MGWLDNLENELSSSKNEAGPSGVTTTKVKEIKPKSSAGKSDIDLKVVNTDTKAKVTQEKPNDTDPKNKTKEQEQQKKKTPTQLFMVRVAIAGLEEAYESKHRIKADTIMFRIALFAAFLVISYETYSIIGQYKNRGTVFDDMLMANDKAPFPHFTICFPANFNETRWDEIFAVNAPKKTVQFMDKNNISSADVVNFIHEALVFNVNFKSAATALYLASVQVYETVLRAGVNPYKLWIPPCPQILSNCTFDGQPFDCCRAAKWLTLAEFSCYEIEVNVIFDTEKIAFANNSFDSMRLESTGLTFDITADWTCGLYKDDIASDGFLFFVGTLPSQAGDPTIIPANMDAVINLAQPKKVSEITHCLPANQVPKLKHFDDYDSNGINCLWDTFIGEISTLINCEMDMLSYFANESCSFVQQFILSISISDSGLETFLGSSVENTNTWIKEKRAEITSTLSGKSCKPVCSRWFYRVLSASYGQIRYQNEKDEQKRQLSNQSWSRIRIVMEDPTPWSHSEQKAASSYLAICNIGVIMGVYAGFSMITFAQILGYGGYVIFSWLKRKRRVSPRQSHSLADILLPTSLVVKISYSASEGATTATTSV